MRKLKNLALMWAIAYLAFGVSFLTPVFASEAVPSSTSGVGPTGTVGSQGTVGPVGPIGPQSTTGPIEPVGPQGEVGPSAAGTAAALSAENRTSNSSQANGLIGANSNNQNSSTSTSKTNADVTNLAQINNTVGATATTGKNTLNQNTAVGSVKTGDVNGTVNIVNIGNSNLAPSSSIGLKSVKAGTAETVALDSASDRASLTEFGVQGNSSTGSNSLNGNDLQNNNVIKVVRLDDATANNQVTVQAVTGNNILNKNTSLGDVKTGNVNLVVNVLNLLNLQMPELALDIDVWTLLSQNPNSTIVTPSNSGTGAHSGNENVVNDDTSANITVDRNAVTNNTVNVKAVTGNNTLNENTVAGNVATGDTHVGGSAVTIANATDPTFYIVNVMGEWNGVLQGILPTNYVINRLDNNLTGADSINKNGVASKNTLDEKIVQHAAATNALTVNAITGGNILNQNTKLGNLTTGAVNVVANLVNILNGWTSGLDKFHLGIINIFGTKAPLAAVEGAATVETVRMPENIIVSVNSESPVAPAIQASVLNRESSIGGSIPIKKSVHSSPIALASFAVLEPKISIGKTQNNEVVVADMIPAAISAQTSSKSDSGFPIPIPVAAGGVVGLIWGLTELATFLSRRRIG